eukprot:SAG11_NODE_25093_length_363_cov_12.242424_1_plen_57_part_10
MPHHLAPPSQERPRLHSHQVLDHPLQSFLLDSLTTIHPASGSLFELPTVEAHPELNQ